MIARTDKNRVIDQNKVLVFDGDIRYDLILGADFLTKSGIDIKYSSGTRVTHERSKEIGQQRVPRHG